MKELTQVTVIDGIPVETSLSTSPSFPLGRPLQASCVQPMFQLKLDDTSNNWHRNPDSYRYDLTGKYCEVCWLYHGFALADWDCGHDEDKEGSE